MQKNCHFFREKGQRKLCSNCNEKDCDGGVGKKTESNFCRTMGGTSVIRCPGLPNGASDKPFPPAPLSHINFPSNKSCTWTIDEERRIITADFTNCTFNHVNKSDLKLLLILYELEDAVVIAKGLARNTLLCTGNDVLEVLTNAKEYHAAKDVNVERIKVFKRGNDGKFTVNEKKNHRSLGQFFIESYSEGEKEKKSIEYLIDYPLHNFTSLEEDFKSKFLIPEILPGGKKCLLSVSVLIPFYTSLCFLSNIFNPFRAHAVQCS